jgi:tetratricopeptide (TPR) repeat protein
MTRGTLSFVATIALTLSGFASYASPASAPAPASTPAPVPASALSPSPSPSPSGYSAPALYNTANAYARAGKPGLAVLNYERARLLEPNDPDIDANLRHVREAAGLAPQTRSRFDRLLGIASPRLFAWVGVLGLLLAGLSALARVRSKAHRRKLLAVMLAGFCLLGLSAANAVALWPILHKAVVTVHSAQVRVSPVTTEAPLFELPEATIVKLRAEHDDFLLIQTAAGRSGWVQTATLAPILPRKRL